jgi:hypothetical protein
MAQLGHRRALENQVHRPVAQRKTKFPLIKIETALKFMICALSFA